MKIMSRMALVSLCVGLAALTAGVANARTPSPTATGTPMPPATATPSPPPPAVFAGTVWVDARIVGDRDLTARIGDTVCGTARPPFISPPGADAPVFGLSVPSDEVLPGCGREGAVVTFFVGGQQAPQTAVWHAGAFEGLALIIGPPFATFGGGLSYNSSRIPAGQAVVPYIKDTPCGYALIPATRDAYRGIAFSNEQELGCGVEGSQVTFKLLDAQGNVLAVAKEKGVWHAWDGVAEPQSLRLTFGSGVGITVGNTGTGDASGGEGSAWGRLSILLGFVGLTGVALGLAVRRHAMTR